MKNFIMRKSPLRTPPMTRRQLLKTLVAAGMSAATSISIPAWSFQEPWRTQVFIGKASTYNVDLASIMVRGFHELGIRLTDIKGKTILLKPNLVETHTGHGHINTHPLFVRGAIEAFFHFGAKKVIVAEGPGHRCDALEILEESGLGPIVREDQVPFVDLNEQTGFVVPNIGKWTELPTFTFPSILRDVDWIVSLPKMKTHHWTGVTLSMKNLFGVMPGIYYGWPKNVFHLAGLHESILDINATLRPHFAIVDGIVGMEGDGPILGTPKAMGLIVMGQNLPAVDATCARVMGIDPRRVSYLAAASDWLGPIAEGSIDQRGEPIWTVRQDFSLVNDIPAHLGLRLGSSIIEKLDVSKHVSSPLRACGHA